MRVKGLHVRNFLSFENFDWAPVGSMANVVVGPNGSGKTNLVHAVRVALQGLRFEGRSGLPESLLRSGAGDFSVALDVEFTELHEVALMKAFLAAALVDGKAFQSAPGPQPSEAQRHTLGAALLGNPDFAVGFVLDGTIAVAWSSFDGWSARYLFGGGKYILSATDSSGVVRREPAWPASVGPLKPSCCLIELSDFRVIVAS